MEREGEREMRRGRREEGKMRKGIVIGGMVLGLLMGCNNGGEDPQKVFLKSVISLGNDFLNVFTSFGDMFSSSLGFKKDLQKSDVRDYFDKVHDKVERTKTALSKIVGDMKEKGNPNAETTDAAVKKLINDKLEIIIQGAKKARDAIGSDAKGPIGNVADGSAGNAAGVKGESEELLKGIKTIVGVVLGEKEGDASAGDDNGPVQDSGEAAAKRASGAGTHGDARKLFANDNAGAATDAAKAAKDAAKAVGAVSGADILRAMVEDNGKAAQLANSSADVSGVVKVADNARDAAIAGGIALRAMAKNGKFAGPTGGTAKPDVAKAVKGAAESAVNKALSTLTIAIRKTIDEELKKVKEAMKINANDNPVNSETAASAK